MLRFILFLVFAFEFNPQQDTSVDLLVILVGTGVLVSGVATLGHAGARAPATRGRAPPLQR